MDGGKPGGTCPHSASGCVLSPSLCLRRPAGGWLTRLEQPACQPEFPQGVFLRLLRIKFDTSRILPYTLLFVRGSFAQAVTRRGYLARAVGRIFTPGTLQDGLGAKSGRNGTPVPQSRVSLSESKPRAEFCLLECVRGFLLVSGIAVSLSA